MRRIPEIANAFGRCDHMPKMHEIPEEFKVTMGNTKWHKAQSQWFFGGLKKSQLVVKEGVDKDKAISAIAAIQRSFEPSHEHKEAAVAYLLSEWFDDYIEE